LAFHSGREADHSPLSGAEVEEWVELYLHSPNAPSWRDAQLKHRDNFIFTEMVCLARIHKTGQLRVEAILSRLVLQNQLMGYLSFTQFFLSNVGIGPRNRP
jgi:hypothetical protein